MENSRKSINTSTPLNSIIFEKLSMPGVFMTDRNKVKDIYSDRFLRELFASTIDFSIKAAIVVALIALMIKSVSPDMDKWRKLDNPMTTLMLLSLVNNPRALLKASEIEEGEGKLDQAVREMELAVGLLEMHGANEQTLSIYQNRLEKLRSRLPKN